jgi:phosphate uptake regulator
MNSLEKGEKINLSIFPDGSLLIQPKMTQEENGRDIHICVESDELKESIVRRIIGAYLNGYKQIKLSSDTIFSPDLQRSIRDVASTLYMMVLESEINSITLQTLIEESNVSVTASIERMHSIAYSMCRDLLNSLKESNLDIAKSVLTLEDDIDQLMFFLLRLIRRAAIEPMLADKLDLDPLDCLDHQNIVLTIERVGDHAMSIANSIIRILESKNRIPPNVLEVFTKVAEIAFTSYDQAILAYLSRNIEKTNEIIDIQKKIDILYDRITPIPLSGESGVTSILSDIINIRESLKKISHHTARTAELTIDRAYRFKRAPASG